MDMPLAIRAGGCRETQTSIVVRCIEATANFSIGALGLKMEGQHTQQTQTAAPEATILAALQARRRSCRKFLPNAIERSVIDAIFSEAQNAASWCNVQPWQVIVTSGESTEKFRQGLYGLASQDGLAANQPEIRSSDKRQSDFAMPLGYSGLRKERRREAGRQLFESLGVLGDRKASHECSLQNFAFFGAPHIAIFTVPEELGVYGVLDTGGYLANVMLTLESHGLASIAQAALAVYGRFVRSHFDIPVDQRIICGMSFGYADLSHPANSFRTKRAEISEVVKFYE